MSNTVRGKAKKGNAPPQDFSGMQHHIGGMAGHSQPPQPPHMQPYITAPVSEMTMAANPNEMNQSYNATPNMHQQRRMQTAPMMTLPHNAQLQQDQNTNGNAAYTVHIPRHGPMAQQSHIIPPPHQSYQPQFYQPMYTQQSFPPQMPPQMQHYQPPRTQQPPKPKKVLKIWNPETNALLNEKEVAMSASAAAPAAPVDSTPVQAPVVPQPASTVAVTATIEQPIVVTDAKPPVAPEHVPSRTSPGNAAIQQRFRAEMANRAFGNNVAQEVREEVQEVPRTAEEQPAVAVCQPEPAPQQVPETPASDAVPTVVVPEAQPVPEDVAPASSGETQTVSVEPTPEPSVSEDAPKEELSRQTSEAPQEDEISAEEKQAALVRKHEEKVLSLREEPSVSLLDRVYGKAYMYAIRDVVAELNIVKCKLSEEELKKFGLDRASMPNQPDSKKRHDSSFTPSWAEGNQGGSRNKPRYMGRGSNPPRKKNPPMMRPSIERTHKAVEPLHKAEKAWKPTSKAKEQIDENTKIFKDIRGLLNKITPTTYPELSLEFMKYEVYKKDDVRNSVIDIIFDKAVEEPKFCPLYSDLCQQQTKNEIENSKTRAFRDGILQKCQRTFENSEKNQTDKLKEEIENETDEKKKSALHDQLVDMQKKDKRRVIGNIGFIGQLYRHNLITPSILNWCVVHLLRCDQDQEKEGGDEESIECAVKMLSNVGKTWDQSGRIKDFPLDTYVGHLQGRASHYSNRVRFMIADLVDLKNRNWIPRKGADSGPKTIKEIQMEAQNEEIQNKVARDNYNERRGLGNSRSKDYSQSGRRNYGGRPSDKRLQGGSSSSSVPVDRSLKKCEPQTSLSSQKNWSGGAGGGGVQGSSSLRSTKGYQGSLTAAVRGNDSQNSSREQSESRKNSLANLRGANRPAEATNGGASPSQPQNDLTEKLQEPNKKIANGVKNDLEEYMQQAVSIDEVFESIQERCSTFSTPEVFMNFISVGGDETKADKRKHLGQMLARCLSDKEMREQALLGITAYCNFVVRAEYWDETANVWEFVADVFRHAILCEGDVFDGARPSIADFDSAFVAANGDQRKPYRLLISLLQKLIMDDDHNIASMAFHELREDFRNEPGLRAALENEKTNGSQHTNLYALLNAQ
ncbi:hypothetical protein QR680_000180 [Steinernema hermaphroditum]|uniref:MIF4G domain-containing protein n=1 Tax=Steinernema hermaphroditum TaxID=289476 RepID=A0AA39GV90_9BILA|nr:hypothetical protein QR680_000180 [Steinernema hermaphroditum]